MILKVILYLIISFCLLYFLFMVQQSYITRKLRKKYKPEENLSKEDDYSHQFNKIEPVEDNSNISIPRKLLDNRK